MLRWRRGLCGRAGVGLRGPREKESFGEAFPAARILGSTTLSFARLRTDARVSGPGAERQRRAVTTVAGQPRRAVGARRCRRPWAAVPGAMR
jgi:hypothetical protein